ncbi:tetratricopeptide repeat protein [Halodesulfovibrio sp. MK-HDV]|jgi:tetratricopeptide (TPR) repeat protein|uniref:tetratricopeptide repeat protein n=1 Tax=Halodesulfovibrio sp. MK-HDV TaxID=2599925 RepID=UPI00136CF520|nr:tetratricopeptide repeat protein [Halodesulfovibrio sp. MK-HDV]KAF1076611.1 hypothetical protein MKHDV_01179 [Halodesulfovibrio sp. MK-HDV]
MTNKEFASIEEYVVFLRKEIDENPECANHHYNLGVALLSARDWSGAEAAFLECVRNSSRFAEAYIQLGGICMQRNDLEGCMQYNKEAAQCRAKFPVPWANMAFVHIQQGDAEEAIKCATKALKWDADFVQAQVTIASAHYMLGELDESEKISKKTIASYPAFAPAYNNLALVALEREDFAVAIENVDKAVELGFEVDPNFLAELAPHREA